MTTSAPEDHGKSSAGPEGMPSERGVSALDRAHAMRLAGDGENALRLAASILVATPEDLGAAGLVSRLLLDAGRREIAGKIAARLVGAFVRRGDLPSACVAAQIGADAGQARATLLRIIAEAFGKGSPRLGDVSPKPPPLPTQVEVAPFFQSASGAALVENAEKALKRGLEQKDSVPPDSQLPTLPLFGALEPPVLEKLLHVQQVRELAAGQPAVLQGQEGQEAFVVARGVLNVVRETSAATTMLAALGPGAIFGEMALVSQTPRGASVVAVEAVQLLVMLRDHLEQLATEEPIIAQELGEFCHGRMVANLIRHSAFLGAVHPAKREDLIERFETRTFEIGEVLVREGQEGPGLFLIASGGVQVSSRDTDGDTVVLADLGPGDVVGEISLLLRRPVTADVVAIHPTVALQLTRVRFQEAMREHPTLLGELYELATKREEETRSVVAQEALDVQDIVIL